MLVQRATPDVRADTVTPRVDDAPHLVLVPPAATAASFCAELKAARESSGLSLAAIAAASKVSIALFTALERGDISRWPKGIYRRSFFRAYAEAVGLPADAAVAEFLRLFPDEVTAEATEARPLSGPTGPLRLTLGDASSGNRLLRFKRWLGSQLIRLGAALSA
jgi:transcriptional regulator with XRE-family HTH domain